MDMVWLPDKRAPFPAAMIQVDFEALVNVLIRHNAFLFIQLVKNVNKESIYRQLQLLTSFHIAISLIATTTVPSITEEAAMKNQTLPFTVSIAKEQDFASIAKLRSDGYGRRSAALGALLSQSEPADLPIPGREILVAKSKLDGALIGTMRLHVGLFEPTSVEKAIELPANLAGQRIMDAARFCCSGGAVCRAAIFKAALLYAKHHAVDQFLLATLERIEPLYLSAGFAPLFDDGRLHPIPMAENLPHRILRINMPTLRADMEMRRPAMVDFLFNTDHGADIDISAALLCSEDSTKKANERLG